ncbi:hypothetical protein T10_11313 [Trichinella papuae]|uniref:Uncharacterized protein n=1 Tax=Trichinella papuae TaxID=268474 RepID=A0A0V1MUG0_9BILA|nr:hypothetical protein T10_11313 [Trichinella papuae]
MLTNIICVSPIIPEAAQPTVCFIRIIALNAVQLLINCLCKLHDARILAVINQSTTLAFKVYCFCLYCVNQIADVRFLLNPEWLAITQQFGSVGKRGRSMLTCINKHKRCCHLNMLLNPKCIMLVTFVSVSVECYSNLETVLVELQTLSSKSNAPIK